VRIRVKNQIPEDSFVMNLPTPGTHSVKIIDILCTFCHDEEQQIEVSWARSLIRKYV
jgi:hypothetical protein